MEEVSSVVNAFFLNGVGFSHHLFSVLCVCAAFENTRKVVESSKNPDQFFRCHFDNLVADPVSMVKSIYDHFGLEFTDRYAKVLDDFVKPDQARQKKEVKHNYSMEQFNLTDDDVNEAYANYIKFVGEKQQLKKK